MEIPLRSGIAALIAIVFSASPAWAARSSGARLTVADKKVSIAGQPATAGTTVAPGDTITTGSRSHAELTLPDGTVVRIGQGSSFTYNGAKLVLNQGTALIHATHKGTTVVSGSRTYTGGPAVVSAEVSKKTDGLYLLQGGGKVNGVTLIPGQSSVFERGKERTFTFDLQKMEASSALVTKFPQTPWIVQTEALALVQHQLLTAKVTPNGKSRPQDGVSGSPASIGNTGSAAIAMDGRSGRAVSPGGGALQLIGGTLSLGADKVAVIKSAVISTVTNGGTITSGGTLTVSGAVVLTNANAVQAGILRVSGGTLDLGISRSGSDSTLNIARALTLNTATNFTLNAGISGGAITGANTNTGAASGLWSLTKAGSGLLTVTANGASTFTGANTVNAGTLAVVDRGNIPNSGVLNVASGTLLTFTNPVVTTNAGAFVFGNGATISNVGSGNQAGVGTLTLVNPNTNLSNFTNLNSGGTIVFATGGTLVVGGTALPQQAGQTVTINGVTYTTAAGAAAGTLTLQRAGQ